MGEKIAKKIDEILATGKLARLERDKHDPHLTAIKELERVTGIGSVAAKKFVEEVQLTMHDFRLNISG